MDIKYSTENNGETYIKLKVGSQIYTITGYSRAGLRTCIMIDELNLCFDMGYASKKSFTYDIKIISHGHCDHIGSLHMDHCARKLFNYDKEKLYIMPAQCMGPFKMMASVISHLNCGKSGNINIISNLSNTKLVSSEDCLYNLFPINKNHNIKSFLGNHKITSYGYIIYRKSNRLKEEYINLPGGEIRDLRLKGVNISNIVNVPLIAYTGDTIIEPIIQNEELLKVPLLIMECTGWSDDDVEEVVSGKHIHLNDIIKYADLFQNEKIILFHFSQKYKKLSNLEEHLEKVPENLRNKIILFF